MIAYCQPARSVIKQPTLAVPALSCDCHAHVLGPPSRYPYVPDRSYTPPDALPSDYLRMLAVLGVERMVVVQASCYGEDNRRTIDAVHELGIHRARGVVMVGARVAEEELNAMHDSGIRATRFITTAKGGPTLDQLSDVAARVAPLGWAIEMYIPPRAWPDVLPIVERLPVPVVFDHMGGMLASTPLSDPVFRRITALLESGRCWTKLTGYRPSVAGPPYADVAPLARHFIARAPDRCVWGTDWPHTNIEGHMPDDGALLDQLATWVDDAGALKKILVHNPEQLYKFNA
ncbi:MAG TPA: amidohydrolase family protein [Casimicrobiaceae bacterium]